MLIPFSEYAILRSFQDSYDTLKTFLRESLNNASNFNLKSVFQADAAGRAVSAAPPARLMDFSVASAAGGSSSIGGPESTAVVITQKFFNENKKQILNILSRLLGLTVSATVTYFLFKWLMKQMDPTNSDKLAAKSRADRILKEIGLKNIELNEYELVIASNLIMPNNIDVSWEDIGGLEHIISDLRETVIYPLKRVSPVPSSPAGVRDTSKRSRLIKPPTGVLFFGPPGNAKTMIAKALAKESGARFINLQVSSLYDKWFGETQKRTDAIFSLAGKIQPVIIFIDEIDTFLRSRKNDDHECTSTMKTQFMTLWDGLATTQHQNRVLIIGATNRPEDVDPAILRRMPQMFFIGLPDIMQRKKILGVILKHETLADDVSLEYIAEKTTDYSGSDLHELCRCAAMNSFVETMKKENAESQDAKAEEEGAKASDSGTVILRKCDFEVAFGKMSIKNSLSKLNRNLYDFDH